MAWPSASPALFRALQPLNAATSVHVECLMVAEWFVGAFVATVFLVAVVHRVSLIGAWLRKEFLPGPTS